MENIILSSYLKQFCDEYDYGAKEESKQFELFTIYSIAEKYSRNDTISKDLLELVTIGNGGDWGIDGIIIIVNGRIVNSVQEIDDLYRANGSLKVIILFSQSKTSKSLNVGEFGNTLEGIENFLKDVLGEKGHFPPSNEDVDRYRNMIKHLYAYSASFESNPQIIMYYVTVGDARYGDDFESKIENAKRFVDSTHLAEKFEAHIFGYKDIIDLYKETKSKTEITIKVSQKLPLPEVDDISDSYLCLIPFSEYRKLIMDENGEIIESVFYDNIRAYQGDNSVNKAITETLQQGNLSLFTAMNNGITIIAKKISVTGLNIVLLDYQIVNGCQTSNVLQRNANIKGINDLVLPVKLIASENKEIRDKIIVANNSQTEVKREQLIALIDTQKTIEDYYNAQNKYERLYYERRSKQYKSDSLSVPTSKVITIPFQIKAFISMILGQPDQVSGYYGSIVENFEKTGIKVFAPDTNPAFYYTSAFASYKMTEAFSSGVLDRKYKQVRFHILLAFRLMCEKEKLPALNSSKAQRYCNYLCDILNDNTRCARGFEAAAKMVDVALNHNPKSQDRFSNQFTKELIKISGELNNGKKSQIK